MTNLAGHDSLASANHVLDQIERVIQSLSEFPHRGNYPRELLLHGIREYREIFFKPYRVIYRVIDESVYIYSHLFGKNPRLQAGKTSVLALALTLS